MADTLTGTAMGSDANSMTARPLIRKAAKVVLEMAGFAILFLIFALGIVAL